MPQVPYQPFPTTQPTSPGERISVQTPGAAFGENIGAALQHLGTTTEQVGGELFNRALAIQQLNNETEARTKAAAYAEQQGMMQADFDSKVGKDQFDSLQPHLQASRKLMGDIRGTISNPMAQRMYDGMTFGFMGRIVRESASRAGTAQKKFTADGYHAERDMYRRQIEDNPDDPELYREGVTKAVDAAKQAAMIDRGVFDENDPGVKDAGIKAEQEILASKITGISRTRPLEAFKLLNENKEALGDQYDKLDSLISTRGVGAASRNITTEIMQSHLQPDGTYNATIKQMQDEGVTKSRKILPDNKAFTDSLSESVVRDLDFKVRTGEFARVTDRHITENQILTILGQHPDVNSTAELLAVPGAEAVVKKLGPFDAAKLDQTIHNARKKEFSEEWAVNSAKLIGLSNNDVTTFLNQDLNKWNLNPAKREELLAKQIKLSQDPKQDPRVEAAMNALMHANGSELSAMGVRRADKNNPNSAYNHFTGALQEALEEWQVDNKKPATYEDVTGPIFKDLLSKVTSRGWFGDYQDFAFKKWSKPLPTEVPEEYAEKVREESFKAGNPRPTDNQIYRIYLRQLFKATMTQSEKADTGAAVP